MMSKVVLTDDEIRDAEHARIREQLRRDAAAALGEHEVPTAERRRALALSLAIEAAPKLTTGARIVVMAGEFEAYLIGAQPDTIPLRGEVLIEFLRTVRDCDVRTDAESGDLVAYRHSDTATWRIAGKIGDAARRAGLAYDDDPGRWTLSPRGSEAADRGTV